MKIQLEDPSGVPEGLKAVVSEEDGKSVLDLTKVMPTEDLTGLKTALQKERANASAYAKLGSVDDITAKIADLEAKAAKGGKGGEEAQAKLDALTAEYDGKLAAKDESLNKLMRKYAQGELKAELAKANIIPEAMDMLAEAAMKQVSFNDDGSVKVLTPDGKPMIGSGADHGATLSDLAQEIAKGAAYAVRDSGKSGSGKQPGSSGGTPDQKTVTRSEFEDMSQLDRATFSKNGGKVVDG